MILSILIPISTFVLKDKLKSDTQYKPLSLLTLNPKLRYPIYSNQVIQGKGLPNAKVVIVISPKGIRQEEKTNAQGQYTFIVPTKLSPGKYRLSIEILDGFNNLATVKSYLIELGREKKPTLSFNLLDSLISKAQAQTNSNFLDARWVKDLQQVGIGAFLDGDDIVLQSQDYTFCTNLDLCQDIKFQISEHYVKEIGNRLKSKHTAFIKNLARKLTSKGYAPLPVLITNFPEIDPEIFEQKFGMTKAFPVWAKTTIEEDAFRDIVRETTPQPLSLGDETNAFFEERRITFFRALVAQLTDSLYDPYEALKPHLPELYQEDKDKIGLHPLFLPPNYRSTAKTFIEKDVLKQKMSDLFRRIEIQYDSSLNKKFYWKNIEETTGTDLLIDVLDPLFATRSIVNVLSLPENEITGEDYFNATLGLTLLAGPAVKVGGTAVTVSKSAFKTILEVRIVIRDVTVLRPAFREYPVTYEIIRGRAESWGRAEHIIDRPKFPIGASLMREGDTPVPLTEQAKFYFFRDVKPALQAQAGYSISRSDVLNPIYNNIKNAISTFELRTGRKLPVSSSFDTAMQYGFAYVVPDQYIREAGAAAYAVGDMFVIRKSSYESYFGLHAMHHELFHMSGAENLLNAKGWRYNGTTEKDQILTKIYELMTEAWADEAQRIQPLSSGSAFFTGGYAQKNPQVLNALYYRLFSRNPALYDDFKEFAISADADKLITNVLRHDLLDRFVRKHFPFIKASQDSYFLSFFRQGRGVNFNAITVVGASISADYVTHGQVLIGEDIISDTYDTDLDEEPRDEVSLVAADTDGKPQPGDIIQAKCVVSEDGLVVDEPEKFTCSYTIQSIPQSSPESMGLVTKVHARNADENIFPSSTVGEAILSTCSAGDICSVTIPSSLLPGTYNLIVLLTKQNNTQVLDGDIASFNLNSSTTSSANPDENTPIDTSNEITERLVKQVIKITFNGEEAPIIDGQAVFSTHLPGAIGQAQSFNIPLVVIFNDGTQYLAYNINYQPSAQGQSQDLESNEDPADPTSSQSICIDTLDNNKQYNLGDYVRRCKDGTRCQYDLFQCGSNDWEYQGVEEDCNRCPEGNSGNQSTEEH